MALKQVFNPLTGNFDLVQNLTDYAKLAISITSADLITAIEGSSLIPNQWYLITDYATKDYIRNSNLSDTKDVLDFHTADVEQIFVKASSANTILSEGFSKTYPSEKIIYQQSRDDYRKELPIEYESGSNSGVQEVSIVSTTELGFTDPLKTLPTSAYIPNTWFDISDNANGSYMYLDQNNYDDFWTLEGNNLKLLKTVEEVLNYAYFYYEDGSNGGDEEITVLSSNSFRIEMSQDFVVRDDFWGYIEDNENHISLDNSNYGTVWTLTEDGGYYRVIELIDSPIDLTNEDYIYIEGEGTYLTDGNPIEISTDCDIYGELSYVVEELGGLIVARENLYSNFYCDCDYRGTKFRRFLADVPAYDSGTTYNEGDIVGYSSYLYICTRDETLNKTPATSGSASYHWHALFEGKRYTHFLCCASMTINYGQGTFTLSADTDTYTDYDMFANQTFDTLNTGYKYISNSKIIKNFSSETDGIDIVFFGSLLKIISSTIKITDADTKVSLGTVDKSNVGFDGVNYINSTSSSLGIVNSNIDKCSDIIVNDISSSKVQDLSFFYSRRMVNVSANVSQITKVLNGGWIFENNTVVKLMSEVSSRGQAISDNTFVDCEKIYTQNALRRNYFSEVYNLYCISTIEDNKVTGSVYNVTCGASGLGGFTGNTVIGSVGTSSNKYSITLSTGFSNNIVFGNIDSFVSGYVNKVYKISNCVFYGSFVGNKIQYTEIERCFFYANVFGTVEGSNASTTYKNFMSDNIFYKGIKNTNLGAKSQTRYNIFLGDIFRLEFADTTADKLLQYNTFLNKVFVFIFTKGNFTNNKVDSIASLTLNCATSSGEFDGNTVGVSFGGTITNDTITDNIIGSNCTLTMPNQVTGCTIKENTTATIPALSNKIYGDFDYEGIIQTTGYKSSDGSAGITGTFTNADGDTVTIKNGLITDIS
ncbi:hypothetical protein EOM57_04460 [Candidatus Saccharibacteria bacterium]|nr:hypothetical protein [Candidatus Saccharibacteria bacterium]